MRAMVKTEEGLRACVEAGGREVVAQAMLARGGEGVSGEGREVLRRLGGSEKDAQKGKGGRGMAMAGRLLRDELLPASPVHAAAAAARGHRPCSLPGCLEDNASKMCGNCKARYCGQKHQEEHWAVHKHVCMQIARGSG